MGVRFGLQLPAAKSKQPSPKGIGQCTGKFTSVKSGSSGRARELWQQAMTGEVNPWETMATNTVPKTRKDDLPRVFIVRATSLCLLAGLDRTDVPYTPFVQTVIVQKVPYA